MDILNSESQACIHLNLNRFFPEITEENTVRLISTGIGTADNCMAAISDADGDKSY
jgi:hypothetical protein